MIGMNREQELTKIGRYIGSMAAKQLIEMGFTTAPASTKFHGCYEGGLFDHSICVLRHLIDLSKKNRLHWERNRSSYIIAIMHDLCKVDQYEKALTPSGGMKYVYRDTEVKGHGEKSLIYAKKLIHLTEEEEICIRYHMGAFTDRSEWNKFTDAVKRYPNLLYVHLADMLASQIDEM